MTMQKIILALFAGALGACLGSFADAAAYRTVRDLKWWGGARSACEKCGNTIAARDLIPMISYIALRGECRNCGAKISKRHILTEITSALLAALFAVTFGPSYALVFSIVALFFLTFHSLTDLESGYIYDSWVAAMAAAGLLLRVAGGVPAVIDGLAGALLGFCSIYAIVIASGGGMGSGDATLAAGIGALFGWKLAIAALYGGFLAGGAYALPMLIAKKIDRKDAVPLGPFLAAGCAAALLTYRAVFEFIGIMPNWPWNI
jgi:prepilin signal peptidase PulO-like enzyme (type II secretory pathway)